MRKETSRVFINFPSFVCKLIFQITKEHNAYRFMCSLTPSLSSFSPSLLFFLFLFRFFSSLVELPFRMFAAVVAFLFSLRQHSYLESTCCRKALCRVVLSWRFILFFSRAKLLQQSHTPTHTLTQSHLRNKGPPIQSGVLQKRFLFSLVLCMYVGSGVLQ